MDKQYVLRDMDDEEIKRLHFQHQVWYEETHTAIGKANIQPGDRILDLGCGPGYLSMDLLKKAGRQGEVYAMDSSEKFIRYLDQQNIPNVHTICADIMDGLSAAHPSLTALNHVFCRWVFIFLGAHESTLQSIYKALSPGGKFISLEYFDFQKIAMSPAIPSFDLIFQNVYQLLVKAGGDPDVGGKMAKQMKKVGFRNIEMIPIEKHGRSGSPFWQLMEQTNQNHKNLVDAGLISQHDLNGFFTDWKKNSENTNAVISSPPLMITIGEK